MHLLDDLMVPFNGALDDGLDTARDGALMVDLMVRLIVHLMVDLIVHLMADLMVDLAVDLMLLLIVD